jgi:hypothetical protein
MPIQNDLTAYPPKTCFVLLCFLKSAVLRYQRVIFLIKDIYDRETFIVSAVSCIYFVSCCMNRGIPYRVHAYFRKE